MDRPPRVDTHSHYLPSFYRDELAQTGHTHLDGMPAIPEWSEDAHLAMMDRLNITRSFLSISSPGTHLTPGKHEAARHLTRRVNAYGADIKRRNPRRFGYFASLPLPDVGGAIAELDIAFDEGADGVALMSNFDGVYLGDAAFDRVFAELDRRQAKVFIHPSAGCLCNPTSYPPTCPPADPGSALDVTGGGDVVAMATPLERHYPAPMMEFLFDTARAVIHLFLQGTVLRYPNITWLIPHVGGALPPLIYRFVGFARFVPSPSVSPELLTLEKVREIFRTRFFFDLAGFAMQGQIDGLMACAGVGKDRLLYGSDYPFTKEPLVENFVNEMDQGMADWAAEEVELAMSGNACKLFGDVGGTKVRQAKHPHKRSCSLPQGHEPVGEATTE